MQMQTLDFGPQTAEVAQIVAGVRDEQLGDPTPCEGTPVAGLLDHLVGLTLAFRMAAEKQPRAGGPRASAENLVPDWRSVLPAQLDALAAAWRDPAAWDGMTEVAGVRMPAGAIGLVALNEVLVHGWDLAAATGQKYVADPVAVEACLKFAIDFAQGAPDQRDEIYGPVVPVPDDAPTFDQLLGQTGRNPHWAPPSA